MAVTSVKNFSNITGFIWHKRTHTGERPYESNQCAKASGTAVVWSSTRRYILKRPCTSVSTVGKVSRIVLLLLDTRVSTLERHLRGFSECDSDSVRLSLLIVRDCTEEQFFENN